jgi:recombinational DNA repair protein RecT
MQEFKLNDEYSIVCEAQGTRNGFRHVAILFKNGAEIDRDKVNYLNRTWERWTFETVIKRLIERHFEREIENLKRQIRNDKKNDKERLTNYEANDKERLDELQKQYEELMNIIRGW